MTLPIQIPVTGTYLIAGTTTPASGTVRFRPYQVTTYTKVVNLPLETVFTLDANGSFSGTLQATNDPAVQPQGWAYQVFEQVQSGRVPFFVFIDYQSAGYDMSTIAPVVPPPQLVSTMGPRGYAPFQPLTAWATGTLYTQGPPASYVSEDGSSYVCLRSHTSGVFATDLANGDWGLVAQNGSLSQAAIDASTAAITAAATATTEAGTATTQAGIASSAATSATASASTATTEAGVATTQAGNAATQASNAATSATASASSATASAASVGALTTDLASNATGKGASLVAYLTGTVKSFLDGLTSAVSNAGAALVGFIQPQTGAVAQTVGQTLQRTIFLDQFGGDPTGGAYSDAAMTNALASIASNPGLYYAGGPKVICSPGKYKFLNTINLKTICTIEGPGSSATTQGTTQFLFPDNVTGIIINSYNTLGNGVQSPVGKGASSSTIRNIEIIGGWAPVKNVPLGTAHGIWLRTTAILDGVYVHNFNGNGIQVVASSGAGGAMEGNASSWYANRCRVATCGQGFYTDGADANAGLAVMLACSACNYSGIYDSSFLGNTYISPQVATVSQCGQVSDGTNRYYCTSDTLGGSTTPGTNSAVWVLLGPGGVNTTSYPLWVSGNVYGKGYAYRTDNSNARNVFIAPYQENDSAPSEVIIPTQIYGGLINYTPTSTAFYVTQNATNGVVNTFSQNSLAGSTTAFMANYAKEANGVWSLIANGDHPAGIALQFDSTNGMWRSWWKNSVGYITEATTCGLTTLQAGTGTNLDGGKKLFPTGFYLGSNLSNLRLFTNGNIVAPGPHAQGEVAFSLTSVAGGNASLVCTKAGNVTALSWVVSHAYTLGTQVTNGVNVYVVTTAGTSASSGGGPTGTGTGIVDGTVVWGYYAVAAVFSKSGINDLQGSTAYAGATIPTGTEVQIAVTVNPGMNIGDFVLASFSLPIGTLKVSAQAVSNTAVSVMLRNDSGSSFTLAACTVKVKVIKQ